MKGVNDMTDEERKVLVEQSMEKNKKGCATKRALEAQRQLYEEAYPFHDVGGYEDMDEIAFGTNDTSDNR